MGTIVKAAERIVAVSPPLFAAGGEPTLFLLRILGIMKSPHLNYKLSQRVGVDSKCALKLYLNGLNHLEADPYFLPLLFEISDISEEEFAQGEEGFVYKPTLNLSLDSISTPSLYLMYNGEHIIIYISKYLFYSQSNCNSEDIAKANSAQAYYEGDYNEEGLSYWLGKIDGLVNFIREFLSF